MAETRSATDASHLLLAGLPPLAIFGLALVTPLALLVLLDPAAKQRIREQGLQMVILYLAAPVGIACPGSDILHDDGFINPSFGHSGSSFSIGWIAVFSSGSVAQLKNAAILSPNRRRHNGILAN
jgi:hypothetical protein